MGARILAGFFVVLVLMAALALVALRYVADANQRLKQIAENNNVKTELATTMHRYLRERALSMHALSILADPFAKDEEIQRFNAYGAAYMKARERLDAMPLTPAESVILKRIHQLTQEAHPKVQVIVEKATFSSDQSEIFEGIRNVAMPRQRAISEQVWALIELQQAQTAAAVREAETAYTQVRSLMFGLGAATLLMGLGIAGFVSRRVASQARQLADQAMHDPLTGLANRSLLQDRLEREIASARRNHASFGVVLLDLDRFKTINDTLGHEIGDEVLREVARRLTKSLRGNDTVARLGGDEYVIVLHDLDHTNVAAVASKVLAVLETPFVWQDQSIDLGASLGIALYPSQCADPSSLIRCADIAMYTAKRSGTGYALYASDQERVSRRDLSLKSELREAIQSGQLTLHYQPQIDHGLGHVVGIEALVRWQHPQRGFLSPDDFIPLAEDAGLIGNLTYWVLNQALQHAMALAASGYPLMVAVNLSARSLHDRELARHVSALLAAHGMPPERLTLEVTESAVMTNPNEGLAILRELDRMGVKLAIDDFGTGYSSLAYLRQLPVNELKIDKSFVIEMEENDNDAVIVRSTIDLAHNLGLRVIAEGVEHRDAWDTLSVLGCDASQGYFLAKPMPFDQLKLWLEQSPWARPCAGATQPARV